MAMLMLILKIWESLVCVCFAFQVLYVFLNWQILKRNNIIFYSDHAKLVLEQSKSDVYREDKDVIISITDNATCPVHMLRRYLALAHIEPDSTDFIFRSSTYCKGSNSYMLRKNSKLSYSTAREVLLSALQS